MKYIMFEVELEGGVKQKIPFIFPSFMVHSEIAKYMEMYMHRIHDFESKVISAGEIRLGDSTTTGDSETLKVKSHPNDARTITDYRFFGGLA